MSDDNKDLPTPEDYAALAKGDEWPESFERERGIYTDVDRQFLWGLKDYGSRVAKSERRSRIRDRTKHGLRDLAYLMFLDEPLRKAIVDGIHTEAPEGSLRDSFAALVEFLYLELDDPVTWLENGVRDGVVRGLDKSLDSDVYGFNDAQVSIQPEPGLDLDQLEATLRSGYAHTLTTGEVGALVRSGRVEPDDLEELAGDPSPYELSGLIVESGEE